MQRCGGIVPHFMETTLVLRRFGETFRKKNLLYFLRVVLDPAYPVMSVDFPIMVLVGMANKILRMHPKPDYSKVSKVL